MGDSLESEDFTNEKSTRGEHGHGFRSNHPNQQAGLLAGGCGINTKTAPRAVELIDVAPTIAKIFGFEMDGVEGKPIEILEGKPSLLRPNRPSIAMA
jgi:hypothetical protein